MARKTQVSDPDELRSLLIGLLKDFEHRLEEDDLRVQVQALVPAVYLLRDLGSSLIPLADAESARERILCYLCRYQLTVIAGDELGVVSGISEYARRVRELRVQFGWPIFSGQTAKEMLREEDSDETGFLFGPELPAEAIRAMSADDYILVGEQDRDAAHRWNLANTIRNLDLSVRNRLLRYLRESVGKPVTGEELRYVAKGATEWGRRTRELRTEEGWPVTTRNSGRPDLPVGFYMLEANRQSPPHDRRIPDLERVSVLERDSFQCRCCGWEPTLRKKGDPRSVLELHHIEHHAEGGSNEKDNLITLCNVHHDEVHRKSLNSIADFDRWLAADCTS
jgi:HNH endonuclease